MGVLRVHEFVTLDGVFENPAWTAPFGFTDAMGEIIGSLTAPASAILLGRATFEMFAPAWAGRSPQDDPGAEFFNGTPKHVVSATLDSADAWQNSRVVGGYDPDVVRALKGSGDVYTSGSGTLVRALLADGLVDELHLLVYPIVLGTGLRLFPEGSVQQTLALRDQHVFDNGVVHLVYSPAA